jgi:hypothetical protein
MDDIEISLIRKLNESYTSANKVSSVLIKTMKSEVFKFNLISECLKNEFRSVET